MTDKMFDSNQVTIAGEIMGGFTFSHDVFGEGFYMMDIAVGRLSDSKDIIPVMVSDRLMDVKQDSPVHMWLLMDSSALITDRKRTAHA